MYCISRGNKLMLCNSSGRVVSVCVKMTTVVAVINSCYPQVKALKVVPQPQDIAITTFLAQPVKYRGVVLSL